MLGLNEMVPENLIRLREEFEHPTLVQIKRFVRGLRTANFISQWVPVTRNTRHTTFDRKTVSDGPCYGPEFALLKERFIEAYTGALRDAKARGVRVVACTMPRNLRDAGPTNYYFSKRVFNDPSTLRRWQNLVDEGTRYLERKNRQQAMSCFSRAEAIDANPAILHFKIGKAEELLGHPEAARARYVKAFELEACPQRALPWVEDAIRVITEAESVPLVDVERMFNEQNSLGLAGGELICDTMHPNLRGHEIIADALLDTISKEWPGLLDRSKDISVEQGRAELGTDRYGASIALRAEVLFNLRVIVQSGARDDLYRRIREACIQLLAQNPSDFELVGARGCLEAVDGNAEAAKKLIEEAMRNNEYVLTSYLYYSKTEGPFQKLFERVGVDLASFERNAKPEVLTAIRNRMTRRAR